MSAVLGLWTLMLGLIGLGWLAGTLMGEGKLRRQLGDEFQAGFDAGYERAKNRYGAMRNGMVEGKAEGRRLKDEVKTARRLNRTDRRWNRETGGLWS